MATNTHQQHPGHNDQGSTPEMYNNNWIKESNAIAPDDSLPYADPALINPEELATFPKQISNDHHHYHHHHESHLVHNKRTPVRDGRNITRTDNHPDRNGFM